MMAKPAEEDRKVEKLNVWVFQFFMQIKQLIDSYQFIRSMI